MRRGGGGGAAARVQAGAPCPPRAAQSHPPPTHPCSAPTWATWCCCSSRWASTTSSTLILWTPRPRVRPPAGLPSALLGCCDACVLRWERLPPMAPPPSSHTHTHTTHHANYTIPLTETMFRALEQLYALGALNDKGELTTMGGWVGWWGGEGANSAGWLAGSPPLVHRSVLPCPPNLPHTLPPCPAFPSPPPPPADPMLAKRMSKPFPPIPPFLPLQAARWQSFRSTPCWPR